MLWNHLWIHDPKPLKAIWEPSKNIEKAYLWKYSKLQIYDALWSQAEGYEDEDANVMDFAPSLNDEVFTIDMPEE